MIKDKRISVVIPARGGSKRLQNKNIHPIWGKPMISWAIRACKRSLYIDNVYVSSDSHDILRVASQYGAISIPRSDKNSSDKALKQDAVLECLRTARRQLGDIPDIVISMQANSPEMSELDIDAAILKFEMCNLNELVTLNVELVQDAAFRIMKYNYAFQRSLSTHLGCYITDYTDVHTAEDVEALEKKRKR